jgi:hypothetical protein
LQPEEILEFMELPKPYRNVYYIGRKAVRVTFLSQQQRAFNLVWALRNSKRLGNYVAVVGGGLAGLSAAIAAQQLGAEVTLFERMPYLMHLQRGCLHRFIHPNIADWPIKGWSDSFTDLPCLNWGADTAARVVENILYQWQEVGLSRSRGTARVQERLSHEVIALKHSNDQYILDVYPQLPFNKPYDCVILALGFGVERMPDSVPFLSYWDNDNLGRSFLTSTSSRTWLVSGGGDGGLIDAIRLKIQDFDQVRFFQNLLEDFPLLDRLLEIDREAQELSNKDPDGRNGEDWLLDQQGNYIYEQYRKLEMLPALRKRLEPQIRSDTSVFLNDHCASPMKLTTSIPHRFVIFLLCECEWLHYCSGDLKSVTRKAGEQQYLVVLDKRDPLVRFKWDMSSPFFDLPKSFDNVSIRHGPDAMAMLGKLLPDVKKEELLADKSRRPTDPTRMKQYDDQFLQSEELNKLKRVSRVKHAIANLSGACESAFGPELEGRFSLEVAKGRIRYVRTHSCPVEPTSPSYADVPITSRAPAPPTPWRRLRPLACGLGIQNSNEPGAAGTLGCFVQLKDGSKAILTSTRVLGPPGRLRIGDPIVQPDGSKDPFNLVARVSQFIPLGPRRESDYGRPKFQGKLEGTVARLELGIDFRQSFPSLRRKLPPLGPAEAPEMGVQVFKVGRTSGLTTGRVTQLDKWTHVRAWGAEYYYEEVFAITGDNRTPFSLPGDEGAVVIRIDNGCVLGLLLAASLHDTLACAILPVLEALECSLILCASRKPRNV